jgi:hypothetical protein
MKKAKGSVKRRESAMGKMGDSSAELYEGAMKLYERGLKGKKFSGVMGITTVLWAGAAGIAALAGAATVVEAALVTAAGLNIIGAAAGLAISKTDKKKASVLLGDMVQHEGFAEAQSRVRNNRRGPEVISEALSDMASMPMVEAPRAKALPTRAPVAYAKPAEPTGSGVDEAHLKAKAELEADARVRQEAHIHMDAWAKATEGGGQKSKFSKDVSDKYAEHEKNINQGAQDQDASAKSQMDKAPQRPTRAPPAKGAPNRGRLRG